MTKILSLIISILMIISMVGCSGIFESEKYEFVEGNEMFVDYNSYWGYSVEIRGKLKNTSKKEYSYISITFAIYDENGNQIETADDSINYLQSGSTWSFKATIIGWLEVEPKSFKFVEVNIW